MKSKSPSKVTPCYFNEDKLRIIIRLRPILNDEDSNEFVELEDNNTLQIKRPGNHTYMKFNNILSSNSGQKDVFNLISDSIQQFLDGVNITIFAYGQTGAGKTYSMIGSYSPKDSQENLFNFLSSKERGVLSRSIEMIMANKKQNMRIFVSFFEIYNEKIFDLYNNTMVPLEIRKLKSGQISIPDLMNVQIENIEDAIQYLMVGLKNRATGSTHGNAQSSRSHSIFQITLQNSTPTGEIACSSLRIVDLAGSEKFKIPADLSPSEKEIRIQELTSINTSLSCLGHCISALIEKTRTHIPFRDSKLTRILSDSLLGQGKMRFIICISPSSTASAETFSTLQFANRAKKAIFQRSELRSPYLNKKKSSENEEISFLRKELEQERQIRLMIQKELAKRTHEKQQVITKQNTYLRKQNQKLRKQVKQLMAKKQMARNLQPSPISQVKQNPYQYLNENPKERQQDLKSEMLKLPIFQKTNMIFHDYQEKQNKKSQRRSPSISKKNVAINKKKAEFEKKIKRFIETDSPPDTTDHLGSNYSNIHPRESQMLGQSKAPTLYYERDNRHLNSISQKEPDQYEDDWINNEEDTQQFIQKTCEQMNLPQFKNFRSQVQRARTQLLLLKQRDQEITNKRKLQ